MTCVKWCILAGALLLAALCAAAVARGQSAFDGSWRISPAQTRFTTKPFTFYVSQGWYHCTSCIPMYDVQADGKDHAVQVQSFDSFSVTVVDANTVRFVARKSGKTVWEATATVSGGRDTLTMKSTGYPQSGGEPQVEVDTYKRIGDLPHGVHATSGNWQSVKFAGSENELLFKCKVSGDELKMTGTTGDSYTAKFDGKDYPYTGSYGADAVSLKRIDARTIEETDKLKGKVQDTQRMTVAPDGKTMTILFHDMLRDTASTYVARKN